MNVVALPGLTQVRLSWDADAGTAGYRLERSVPGDDYAPLATLPAGSRSAVDSDVLPATLYRYRLIPSGTVRDGPAALAANEAPVAAIQGTPEGVIRAGGVISFDAGTVDSDDEFAGLRFEWDLDGDGAVDVAGPTASWRYDHEGTFTAQLRPIDSDGAVGMAETVVVVVSGVNLPPVARFDFSPASPVAGQPIPFDASASSDDQGIAGYRWDFNDDGTFDATGVAHPASAMAWQAPGR